MSTPNYAPLHGLPALAGLATFDAAQRPGLAIEECVRRLKRFHYSLKRLHEIFLARLTSEPIYELKMAFSLHAHYCAEHTAALRVRVAEMREPPLGLDLVPDPALGVFFDEIFAAPSTAALLDGLYAKAIPALIADMEKYREETNPLADAPSVRLAKFALIELHEMAAYGAQAVPAIEAAKLPESATPFVFDPIPRRDTRFPDPYNMGVNAEAFLYSPDYAPDPKVLMMFYKRLREIDVPEMMSTMIAETKGKPWGFYRDMTRQLWDEARHAMMGEVGFIHLGIDWTKVMVNFTWSLGLNTQLSPKERHGVLYFIEQGLMPKTGKRFEWEVALASHHALSGLFQDFDWADEVLHSRIGRDWYVSQFENPKEAVEYGDKAWSKVLIGWRQWRDEGLTAHRNWWPDVYTSYCSAQYLAPDPAVLAFDETYEQKRADLKAIPASA